MQIVDTDRAVRVLETAGAPVVYIAPEEIAAGSLRDASGTSFCEWKGTASYFGVLAGEHVAANAAWAYRAPTPPFAAIASWVSFYPALIDCLLDDEPVSPQPGGFYGGWVTLEIAGPIKGGPGSAGW
ncbi:MAG: DUF427 domain-containing protein [Solirubrobacterales bacterium]|nr:DUF427 domain-containing protein [Solirubrobacterales bacterium]